MRSTMTSVGDQAYSRWQPTYQYAAYCMQRTVCCLICDDLSQLKFFDITVLSLVNCIFDELNAFSSRVLMSCYSACSKETSVEQGRVPFQLCNHSKMTYNDLDTIIFMLTRASSQCHLCNWRVQVSNFCIWWARLANSWTANADLMEFPVCIGIFQARCLLSPRFLGVYLFRFFGFITVSFLKSL